VTDQVIELMTRETSRRDALAWFLRTQRSEHTARAYDQAIRDFESVNGGLENGISREKVSEWVARMGERGLADTTINQRLAALSAYVGFLGDMKLESEAGEIAGFVNKLRRRVNPYGKSRYLNSAQLKRLLSAINVDTVQGSRDYALFLMFIATGRRSSEIRNLQWKHFEVESSLVRYRWTGKGNSAMCECPWDVWQAIINWLNRSGRLIHMVDDDYIFTAISESASRLPRVNDCWKPGQAPLTMPTLGQLFTRYAKKAGIGGKVHIHMLRHSAAMLHLEAGEDITSIQRFLGHKDVQSTTIYLHKIAEGGGYVDKNWGKIKDLLGL